MSTGARFPKPGSLRSVWPNRKPASPPFQAPRRNERAAPRSSVRRNPVLALPLRPAQRL
jgi:hypothetical protein